MTLFIAAGSTDSKAVAIRQAISHASERYVVDPSSLGWVPGSPFAYWVSDRIRELFRDLPKFARDGVAVRQGLATADDFRFARCWWECRIVDIGVRYFPMSKGGPFSRFYADLPLVVLWAGNGVEIRNFYKSGSDRLASRPQSVEYYFQPGLTWPLRSHTFCPRYLPAGSIISVRGSGIYGPLVAPFAGLGSSAVADLLLRMLSGRLGHPQFDMGDLAILPVPDLDEQSSERLGGLARSGWSLKRFLDTCNEVSHAFVVPAVLQVEGSGFGGRVEGWGEWVAEVEGELESVQAEIDEVCFELYGIPEEDRRAITEGFGISDEEGDEDGDWDDDESDGDEESGSGVEVDPVELAAGLVSWCVGVGVGRFDVRLATGERAWPSEPDPFDPLPVCSGGMLTGEDGLPLVEPPDGYPVSTSPVLVVDPGHRLDVAARVREVFEVVFGGETDSWWTEVGEVLDRRGELGSWLSKGFFDHHLKTYSKSRRKAPVIWPIGTRSGSYQVWLYAHRVTGDSLFRVLNDLIVPKLNAEESKLTRLRQEAGPNPSASERKAIDVQERFVSELVELREAVEELAPLWAPDLNDGIVIVLAPLWRLFAHHKPWMRELKKHWAKLVKGEYDWAQLAMHLWPERVIPKCAEDRSLAIAHGLEDVFWQPDPDNENKWIPRPDPTIPVDQLIANHHNPATKTALTRTEPA